MSERTCFVLLQSREESEYNDFIGKFYHFPKKYLKQLSHPDIEFIYYEPKKKGEGVYFGYGRIKRIFEDKRETEHYFAEVDDYKSFAVPVPFLDESGKQREQGPGFNIQNSVRSIDSKILDEICLDGGILLNFQADAHLIQVLGEQLIATESVGILELIKNSYDAGASYCNIRVEKVPILDEIDKSEYKFNNFEGPVIIIEDDGMGMDKETIENGWLRPASTLKTNIKQKIKMEREKALKENKLGVYNSLVKALKEEHGGRLPLGEKGVGRFATHRLGSKLLIKTKTIKDNYEYVLKIDWDQFDKLEENKFIDLDSIGISLFRQRPSISYGTKGSGTLIVIYGGRDGYELTEENILAINKTILSLKSPYSETAPVNFLVAFECPQVKKLLADEKSLLEEFPPIFSLNGEVNEKGIFHYDLTFSPPSSVSFPGETKKNEEFDLKIVNEDHWKKTGTGKFRSPSCGKFFIHIDAWYRRKPWIDGPNYKKFPEYLDNYGGISIFRDGLNIFPAEWGSETDWLRITKRHIKQGFRISYYNFLGNIELKQEDNIDIIDKTDRQGQVKTQAFNDLGELTRAIVIGILENYFRGKRDDYEKLMVGVEVTPEQLKKSPKEAAKIMDEMSAKYDFEKDPYLFFPKLANGEDKKQYLVNLSSSLKNLEKSLKVMQEAQDLMAEQAGYGLSIGIAVHEIAKITANFYNGVRILLDSNRLDRVKLEDLKESAASIRTEINRLGPLRAIKNESPMQFNVKKSINFAYEVFRKKIEKLKIDFQIIGDSGFELFTRYGAVNQIFTNLIDNSCYWVDTEKLGDRKIIVKIDSKYRTVLFADSGPDIHESIRPYLFEPGYSLRVPQSGLGLYICKYYMKTMKGDIHLVSDKDRIKIKGAQFILDFTRVLAEKTKS